jgi:hypothetical protein
MGQHLYNCHTAPLAVMQKTESLWFFQSIHERCYILNKLTVCNGIDYPERPARRRYEEQGNSCQAAHANVTVKIIRKNTSLPY